MRLLDKFNLPKGENPGSAEQLAWRSALAKIAERNSAKRATAQRPVSSRASRRARGQRGEHGQRIFRAGYAKGAGTASILTHVSVNGVRMNVNEYAECHTKAGAFSPQKFGRVAKRIRENGSAT